MIIVLPVTVWTNGSISPDILLCSDVGHSNVRHMKNTMYRMYTCSGHIQGGQKSDNITFVRCYHFYHLYRAHLVRLHQVKHLIQTAGFADWSPWKSNSSCVVILLNGSWMNSKINYILVQLVPSVDNSFAEEIVAQIFVSSMLENFKEWSCVRLSLLSSKSAFGPSGLRLRPLGPKLASPLPNYPPHFQIPSDANDVGFSPKYCCITWGWGRGAVGMKEERWNGGEGGIKRAVPLFKTFWRPCVSK